MDARANAAPRAVGIVVSIFKVSGSSLLGSEESSAFIAVRVEDVRVGKAVRIVMESPNVQNDSTSFRKVHIVDGVI